MADFPDNVFSQRTIANVTGVEFDAAKTTRIFAEDLVALGDEITAIEEWLEGALPLDITYSTLGTSALDIQTGRSAACRAATGVYSVALGYDNKASGDSAVALGKTNTASGDYSTGIGRGNCATSIGSSALGFSNAACGDYSSAFGTQNVTTGVRSSSFGDENSVVGDASTASGAYNCITSGASSASGFYNTVSGYYGTAVGAVNTVSGYYSVALGLGLNTTASGNVEIGTADSTKSFSAYDGSFNAQSFGHIPAGSAPASPFEGQTYYNSSSKHWLGYNGSTWKQLDN